MDIQSLANLLGYIGLLIIFVQVVLGSRHVFGYITKDTVLMNKIHKYLGIYGIILALAHPIEEAVAYMSDWLWIFIINFNLESETYISLGRIALYLLLIIWITSAIVREQIKWRPWKYIHLLSYPLFLFSVLHAMYAGRWAEQYPILYTVLYASIIIFILTVLRRLLAWMTIGKIKYTIVGLESVQGEIIILTLSPSIYESNYKASDYVVPAIGQHMYIQLGAMSSEHPLTVMEYKSNGELVFAIRNSGRFGLDLHNKLMGETVYLDGPYGNFTKEAQNHEDKVIISGGVGVTPFIRLIEQYGGDNVWYINCNRNLDVAIRREYIMTKVGHYKDVLGIIDENAIVEFVSNIKDKKYFICGAPQFIYAVKKILLGLGVRKNKVYYEELGF